MADQNQEQVIDAAEGSTLVIQPGDKVLVRGEEPDQPHIHIECRSKNLCEGCCDSESDSEESELEEEEVEKDLDDSDRDFLERLRAHNNLLLEQIERDKATPIPRVGYDSAMDRLYITHGYDIMYYFVLFVVMIIGSLVFVFIMQRFISYTMDRPTLKWMQSI